MLACRMVEDMVMQMRPKGPSRLVDSHLTVEPADLYPAGIYVSRFAQQFAGSAGPICREALLLDVSNDNLSRIANAKFTQIRRERESWAKLIITFVGMFALIALVYAFLNAATRGYYTWALRVAAIVLAGVGVVVLVLMAT